MSHYGIRNPGARIALIAPTFPDARDTMVEGESGLLATIPGDLISDWNRSLGELILTNRTQYKLFTAEKPNKLRGPQHHRAWCDEIGSWRYATETWDMMSFGLRLGKDPRAVATTTPLPIKLLRELIADDTTVLTRGSLYDNEANLPETFVTKIRKKYEGSRLGRQEIYAELLDDLPGALWQRAQIDTLRILNVSPLEMAKRCIRIVIAIDPAVTSEEDADLTGISAVGIDEEHNGHVLADESMRDTPRAWARAAIRLFRQFGADRVIGETNNGGDLVEEVLRMEDPNIPYKKVTASRGKYVRAEPIATLYEQGRIHHIGTFDELEDQMCLFTPDNIAKQSPDRAEAMIWGFTELFDGCLNLGVLEYAKTMKANRDKIAMAEAPAIVAPLCPTCHSSAVIMVGRGMRCNQCGESWGINPTATLVINRNNVNKFTGVRR